MSTRGGPGHRGGGGPRGGDKCRQRLHRSPSSGIPAPSQAVTRVEDALQVSTASLDLGNLRLQDAFPTRPGYGTKGRTVVLWANYVALTASPKLVLYRYDISVSPAAAGKKLTQIMRLLMQAPELANLIGDVVTDFKSTLISRQRFEDQTVAVQYRAEGEDEPRDGSTPYRVQLKFTNVLPVSQLTEYLTSTNLSAQYDEQLPMIQAFNIFLNHHAKSSGNLANIGASKTFSLSDRSDTWDLGNCLTAVRGFFASVRAATARVLVNVNVSHGAFYQEGPLDQFMLRFGAQRGLYKLEAFLKRLRVRTTHLKEKKNKAGEVVPRVKTVFGFANKNDGHGLGHPPRVRAFGAGPKDVEFWLESGSASGTSAPAGQKKGGKKVKPAEAAGGRYISVYEFFVSAYGMRIANPDLPVINVGNRENPTYLPPQVCYVIPGQPAKAKLDPTQTQNMIRFAVRGPEQNATSIVTKGLQTAGLSPSTNPLLGQFGITISPDLITVPGRVLAGPQVVYKDKRAQMMAGGWNMVPRDSPSLKFNASMSVRTWSCLYIEMPDDMYPGAHRFTPQALKDLVKRFHAVLNDTGIAAKPPLEPLQRVQLSDTDDAQLEPFFQRAAASLQLLFVILPASPIPLYNRIKQLGDVKYGVHTICSVGKKIAKPQGQDQYLRNEALKFNLKLGGNNQLVEPARRDLIAEDKTMVVGIDVTHPSPGSALLAPSVAGMVASVDRWLGQWPAVIRIQPKRRQEIVGDLEEMLKSRLRLWRDKGKHAALPENILVYRDGVSEGQYQIVLDEELPLLRAACKELYPAADQAKGLPRLTVVVVGKRHHTRFYPTQEADADRSGNTKPGTVVDRGITEARSWDFFLQAHTALQGTARPAHYFVVLDEVFRRRHAKSRGTEASDELQELTQNMCYVFGRATKAVSICTPAYYADILCERARCYLSSMFETPSSSAAPSAAGSVEGVGASQEDVQIHEKLRDTMFYI
ncbi:Protein argonaute 5 [Tolypocladium paradoxum]|uniref:Protein argonaute 5 n=1 Tax=Tolypocladium paradoxum TaxID=94208 RepID=A0A2S4KVX0_9HYPO|nr:Protein argonaute 5 [Tolypocladium paradoxum]